MNNPVWTMLHPKMTLEHLGYIPLFLNTNDLRKASEQFHSNYSHGGGWEPFPGFTLHKNRSLSYPGDPEMLPLAETKLRDETILYYPHSWVAIIQSDGSYEIARLD